LGDGFFAGFVHRRDDNGAVAKQLHRLFTHGLLAPARHDRYPLGTVAVAATGLDGL
jgi:hypothetical protein